MNTWLSLNRFCILWNANDACTASVSMRTNTHTHIQSHSVHISVCDRKSKRSIQANIRIDVCVCVCAACILYISIAIFTIRKHPLCLFIANENSMQWSGNTKNGHFTDSEKWMGSFWSCCSISLFLSDFLEPLIRIVLFAHNCMRNSDRWTYIIIANSVKMCWSQ